MRKPTASHVVYQWHSDAMAGLRPDVVEDHPECGWYAVRDVSGGPLIPVRIKLRQVIGQDGTLLEPEEVRAQRAQERVPVALVWPGCARHAISEERYHDLVQRADAPTMRATMVEVDNSERPVRP